MEIEVFENIFFFLLLSVLDNFGFSDISISRFHVFRENLCENEFFSETILDGLSRTQMGWINEKKMKKIT